MDPGIAYRRGIESAKKLQEEGNLSISIL